MSLGEEQQGVKSALLIPLRDRYAPARDGGNADLERIAAQLSRFVMKLRGVNAL